MNDLTAIRQQPHSAGSSEQSRIATELAKMLALVAPVTMTGDQQTMWISSAVDALAGIRANEVEAISLEVRRAVSRPSQIVPEISRLVSERRAHQSRLSEHTPPALPEPLSDGHLMDKRGKPMSEADTETLNRILESLGATARYRPDGSRYTVAA